MRIAYRRLSGAIGLTKDESGTRGLWWEKRIALVNCLTGRGHQVDFVNRFTKPTAAHYDPAEYDSQDLLIVEFGSSNERFYGDDIKATIELCERHRGPKIFLCDDPDLPFLWKKIANLNNWSCWYNCVYPSYFPGQPEKVTAFDFPFSSLQTAMRPTETYCDSFCYIGRPNGREKAIKQLIAGAIPWRVYGRPPEWEKFGMRAHEAPDQPGRADFYSKQLGCLVLSDTKHKRLGWRTGRAYHAVLAGCPAVIEASHIHIAAFHKFASNADLMRLFYRWKDPGLRADDWQIQMALVDQDTAIMKKTLEAHGL